MSDRFPKVQGRCPSCHQPTLFLALGGYVTCGWSVCSGPTALADLLDDQRVAPLLAAAAGLLRVLPVEVPA